MIRAGWRRAGISPAALVTAAMALVAFGLSRTGGSGWLVAVAAGLVAVLGLAAAWTMAGLAGVRVDLDGPADATAGDTVPVRLTLRAPFRQLRLVHLLDLDRSVHAVGARTRGPATLRVRTPRRQLVAELTVEVQAGFPLGLFTSRRPFRIRLDPPLAVAPVAAPVVLARVLGDDDGATIRGVRPYLRGDSLRLVHWPSTARRGELLVRELESAVARRGQRLVVRVDLRGDPHGAEAAAGRALGVIHAALDEGMDVDLLTVEGSPAGPRAGPVRTRRAAGRRLAAAVPGPPPPPPPPAGRTIRVVEVRAGDGSEPTP